MTGDILKIQWNKVIPNVYIITVAIAVLYNTLEITKVKGDSMNPLIQNGQVAYSLKTIKFNRNEVVIADSEEGKVIKRVYALPGENIKITKGKIYVNEQLVKVLESHVPSIETTLEEGQYLLLGDNPNTAYIITKDVNSRVEVLR